MAIAPFYAQMTEATHTDWMKAFPEDQGESLSHFMKDAEAEQPLDRKTIFMGFVGKAPAPAIQAVFEDVASFLALFYGARVEWLLPANNKDLQKNSKGQINVEDITDQLVPDWVSETQAGRSLSVIAITDEDLYAPRMNFVFGSASAKIPALAFSYARFGNPNGNSDEKKLFFQRLLKIAAHETGHTLGLTHCTTHRCGMNGYNHLQELDSDITELCPDCQAKTWHGLHLDPARRYEALLSWAKAHPGLLDRESLIWRQSLNALKKTEK